MEYLGAWGTLIHEKNLKSKIFCQTPFKNVGASFQWHVDRAIKDCEAAFAGLDDIIIFCRTHKEHIGHM
jgi:hypothetical protein